MEIFQREMPLNEADPNNLLMHINRHLERIAGLSSLTIDDLKAAILGDPVLFNALKGVSGDTIQNYGGSLLKNGANEIQNGNNWSSPQLFQNQELIVSSNSAINLTKLRIGTRILKLEFEYKLTISPQIYGLVTKYENDIIVPNTYQFGTLGVQENYVKTIKYLYLPTDIDTNVYSNLFFGGSGSGVLSVKKLIVQYLEKGEPVPFNLPYLPLGQMVFDPTDGSVGRYNGTTIDWFTMA